MRLLLVLALASAACIAPPRNSQSTNDSVSNVTKTQTLTGSTWGTDGARLLISSDGGRFESNCIAVDISERIEAPDGRFTVTGVLRRTGGARSDDAPTEVVHLDGAIDGDRLTLKLRRASNETISFTLTRGAEGNVRACA